ncbi:MAG: class I SAM-dependent methyltransferase [Alphaproteobacteria bacterium]|nr:class I SAM-dependent methyltransferase [Alphaproteobacteria bacterium]MCB9929577.1 class I SAM-dependent methyltransferase [Alphaproteobacteria bacterium]
MAQNIYDNPEFFAGYSGLNRSVRGLAGAPEWPSVRALLPSLAGKRVVDLGCGFGAFARWAAEQGAAEVVAFDLSENMLARARAETAAEQVRYGRADLEALVLPEAAFDVAYSALAFHYVEDFGRLMATVRASLRPGGVLVFTIEHPIYMAPAEPGWQTAADGRQVWPLDGYGREGRRETNWFADGVVKYHRTLGTTLNTLIRSGFSISHVEEWRPSDAQVAAVPDYAPEVERPMFLLVRADRP